MVILDFSIKPNTVKETTTFRIDTDDLPNFPLLTIGIDSYIVSSEIQSIINFDNKKISHNLQIGNYCSIADKIKFMLGLNHDYKSITTGVCGFLENVEPIKKIKRKSQIIIQNDVWIGSGATIMSGVTVHNGAVVSANAHVVKDVPAYAIVGGNPAKIIKYRFTEKQIEKLLKIAWWDWGHEKLIQNRDSFNLNIDQFIDAFYDKSITDIMPINYTKIRPTYLFFLDVGLEYSITEHVVENFWRCYGENRAATLFIYFEDSGENTKKQVVQSLLARYPFIANQDVVLASGKLINEKSLFGIADYYITTRAAETVRRTCYADEYNVKIVSGVDSPVFALT